MGYGVRTGLKPTRTCVAVAVAVLSHASPCWADAKARPASAAPDASELARKAADNPYATLSNEPFITVTADRVERRWFFAEMRKRMASDGPRLHTRMRTEVRFGRVFRNSEGSVVRIKAVRAVSIPHPAGQGERTSETPAKEYGLGFERRQESRQQSEADAAAPATPTIPVKTSASDVRDSSIPLRLRGQPLP